MGSKYKRSQKEVGIEMTRVAVHSGGTEARATTTCTPEVCRQARQRYQPPDLATDSPWNQKKTYFFIGTIGVFIIWVIIYTIVSELKLV